MLSVLLNVATLFSLLAVATPMPSPTTGEGATTTVTVTQTVTSTPVSQCNTGPVQCCNSYTTAGDPAAANILSKLNVAVQDVNVPVGLQCSPITGLGIGGTSCSQTPVCCENNNYSGVIVIGCVPIIINA